MTIRILLSISEFKDCSIAGILQLHSSVSSLCYVKQIGSYICDPTLEQTSGYPEVFSQLNSSLKGKYY